jgi:hypothetical protein
MLRLVPALLLGMAACNRPAAEPPPNLLATSVAATLTAQPLAPATPIASLTPAPPAESPTPAETALPTESVSPTPPPIPLSPDDPRAGLNLSAPDVRDDFSELLWYIGSDPASASFAYRDGRFEVVDNLADGFLWWSTTARTASDLYVEVGAEIGECRGKDASGLAIRVGGAGIDEGYTLEVACDGSYRLRRFVSQEPPITLVDWTPASALISGPEATNRIGLLARGPEIYVFANGERLTADAVRDDHYTSGILSLFASADQTAGLTVHFDDFALWYLSP